MKFMVSHAFGDDALNHLNEPDWHKWFTEVREMIEDDEWLGRRRVGQNPIF